MGHKFNETEIREILRRAEEIHVGGSQEQESEADSKALIKAAEEAGLPREAVEQALQERLQQTAAPNTPGEFIYAPSTDGKLYVAEVISSQNGTITAKFLNGSETTFPASEAQPAHFLPGAKVQANWPNFGWWTCTVLGFDKPNRLIRLTDGWGTEKSFPLADIRYVPKKEHTTTLNKKLLDFWEANKMYIIIAAGIVFLLSRIFIR